MSRRRERRRQGRAMVVNGVPIPGSAATSSLLANGVQGKWLARHAHRVRGRLLDLGAGNQPYLSWYGPLSDSVVAVDAIPGEGTDVLCLATALPFADNTFDTVLCTNVLEHVENAELAVSEAFRVLRPGGHMLVSVPFLYPTHEAPYDFWRTTHHGLRSVLERHGFRIEEMGAQGGPMLLIAHYFFGALSQALTLMGQKLGPLGRLVDSRVSRRLLAMPQLGLLRAFSSTLTPSARMMSVAYMACGSKPDH